MPEDKYSDELFEFFDPGFRVWSTKKREEFVRSLANAISADREAWEALPEEDKVIMRLAFAEYDIDLDSVLKGAPATKPTGWDWLSSKAKGLAERGVRFGFGLLEAPFIPTYIAAEYAARKGERERAGERLSFLEKLKELGGAIVKTGRDISPFVKGEWFPGFTTIPEAIERAAGRKPTPTETAIGTAIEYGTGLATGAAGILALKKFLKLLPHETLGEGLKRMRRGAKELRYMPGAPGTNIIEETMEKIPFGDEFPYYDDKAKKKVFVTALEPEPGMSPGMIMVRVSKSAEDAKAGKGRVFPMDVLNFWRRYNKAITQRSE